MRDLYDAIEKLLLSKKLATRTLVSVITDRLYVSDRDSGIYHAVIQEIGRNHGWSVASLTGINNIIYVVPFSISNPYEYSKKIEDIGNGITIYSEIRETFYHFLVRNKILTTDKKIQLQRLVMEYV